MSISLSPQLNEKINRIAGWRTVKFGDVVRNVDISEPEPLKKGIERYVG